jgi:hypothetical protein
MTWMTDSAPTAQEYGQELRAHDQDDPQPRVRIQSAGQQLKEGDALGLPGQSDQLLSLINDHQHWGMWTAANGTKLLSKAMNRHILGDTSWVCCRETPGEAAQRMIPRHHRGHHDPASAALPKPRYYPRLDQRRFPRTRGTDHRHQPIGLHRGYRMKTVQQLGDFGVAAEKHCRVLLSERLQPRKRRPIRIPDRTSRQR